MNNEAPKKQNLSSAKSEVSKLEKGVSELSIADVFYSPKLEAMEEERGINFEDSLETRKPWKTRDLHF